MTPLPRVKFEIHKWHGAKMTSTSQRHNYGTQRNHIIPQSHMRNFAKNIGGNDLVYLYNLQDAKTEQNYNPKRLTVENSAVQKGFYTDEYERRSAEKYESPAIPVINKMIAGKTLTFEEREFTATYLLNYHTRSPSQLAFISEQAIPWSEEGLNYIKRTYSTIREALIEREENFSEELFDGIVHYRGEEEQYIQLGGRLFAEGQFLTQGLMNRASKLLASLKWRIVISENQSFILGDTFFTKEYLDQPFYELFAPLGSNHCLFVSRYIHDLNTRWDTERIPICQADARAINVRTAKVATKYIVSGMDNLAWVKSARQTPNKSHRNITIPGFTNFRILNEFMTERCPNCWYSLQEQEREPFHTEVLEVIDGQVMVNSSVQSKCSHCHFATDFQSPTDSKVYPIGVQAARIRGRLIPAPE